MSRHAILAIVEYLGESITLPQALYRTLLVRIFMTYLILILVIPILLSVFKYEEAEIPGVVDG